MSAAEHRWAFGEYGPVCVDCYEHFVLVALQYSWDLREAEQSQSIGLN